MFNKTRFVISTSVAGGSLLFGIIGLGKMVQETGQELSRCIDERAKQSQDPRVKNVKITKDFLIRHRTAIAVTGTAVVFVKLNKRNIRMYDEFLIEHDLYDTFWTIFDEE